MDPTEEAVWLPGSPKNQIVAVASFVIPGSGQFAQRRYQRAAVLFIGAVILWFVRLGWVVHIIAAVDAANFRSGQPYVRTRGPRRSHPAYARGADARETSPPPPPPPPKPISEELAHARVLGLRGKVTMSDVRAAYRKAIAEYHPDKVAHLGEKLREVATAETVKLNVAYQYFQKRYGKD
jgi:hypothetical protein